MTLPAFTHLPAGDLVLASASIIRAKILHDAGLGYRCLEAAGLCFGSPTSPPPCHFLICLNLRGICEEKKVNSRLH